MLQTKKEIIVAFILVMAFVVVAGCDCERIQANSEPGHKTLTGCQNVNAVWNFDDVLLGQIPAGWKVGVTNWSGPLPTWQVTKSATAPSGDQVLTMISPNHTSGGTFNLCWMDAVAFCDGQIEVSFKSLKGKEDQGGGVIWRARDTNNYYIARFNPLEDNFRIYYVRDGVRRKLESARVALSAGKWHTLRIVQNSNQFEGYLDGNKILDGTNDIFTGSGGVGLWTKADSVTSFDDFRITSLPPKKTDHKGVL